MTVLSISLHLHVVMYFIPSILAFESCDKTSQKVGWLVGWAEQNRPDQTRPDDISDSTNKESSIRNA
jgi:hypothetical protein